MARLKEQYQNEIVDALIRNLVTRTSWKFRSLIRSLSTWALAKQRTMQRFWIPQLEIRDHYRTESS